MTYQEIFDTYEELKNNLQEKKEAIIKKNTDKLANLDEMSIALCEKIEKLDIKNKARNFNPEEKEKLKELGNKIKEIQSNNEVLIKHSLEVVNSTLSGVFNLIQKKNTSYNAKGKSCNNSENLDISSITQEA